MPLDPADPLNPMNRRISLVVLNDKTERQIRGIPEEAAEEIEDEADAIRVLGLAPDDPAAAPSQPADEPATEQLAQPAPGRPPA